MVKRKEYDFSGEIMRRKDLLLRRDPLAKDLENSLKEYILKRESAKSAGVSFESGFPKDIEDVSAQIDRLVSEIEKKWRGTVYIPDFIRTCQLPLNSPSSITMSKVRDNISKLWGLLGSIYMIKGAHQVWPRYLGKDKQGRDVIFASQTFREPSSNGFGYYIGGPDDLVIRVNTSVIDLADADRLKKQFWAMVENEVKEKRQGKKQKRLDELDRLYHIKPETFDSYLNWYDLHNKNRWSFRKIALVETSKDKEAVTEQLRGRRRVGFPVKQESTIRKGVKLIAWFIHRKPLAKPADELEEYNCPEHGKDCTPDCSYFLDQKERYDQIYRFRDPPWISLEELAEIPDPKQAEEFNKIDFNH